MTRLPPNSKKLSRRDFVTYSAVAATALAFGLRARAHAEPPPRRWPIVGFSKPFQQLDAAATAEFVAAIGWDGLECPVRVKGQIEPERAPDELPKMAEALRSRGKELSIIATNITSMGQPHTETVLRAAAETGVKRIRLGSQKYDLTRSLTDQLKEIGPAIKDIADACRDLGLQAGIQNHSGHNYIGAPVWDVVGLVRDLDPKHLGVYFDIGHATIEGGLSWPIQARLAEPFYGAVYVKDFVWTKTDRRWRSKWCPLGDGMVSPSFFTELKKTAFAGPICQHHEYELGDLAQMTAHLRHDLEVLRSWLAPEIAAV